MKYYNIKYYIILFVSMLYAIQGIAQQGIVMGVPQIENYLPQSYNARAQNWAVLQDAQGIMYFGNNEGVLQFDGSSWRSIAVTNGSAVRSLAVDDTGTVYVGATGEFGYLEPDQQYHLRYKSLSKNIPNANFTQVWKIFATRRGIYFFAGRTKLYRYYGGKLTEIAVDSRIKSFRGFMIDNKIYAIDSESGFAILRNDSLVSLQAGADVVKKRIYSMLPYNKGILIGTADDALYLMNDDAGKLRFEKFPTNVDAFLIKNELYHGVRMHDGSYAYATLYGGIAIINQKGKARQIINKRKGLPANAVYYMYEDRHRNLWAGTEKGVSQIIINSSFSRINEVNGLDGSITFSTRFKGLQYIATSSGIFVWDDNKQIAPDELQTVKSLGNDYSYVLDFCQYTTPDKRFNIMLASSLREVIMIADYNQIKNIKKLYSCFSICPSARHNGRFLLGHAKGIDVITLDFPKSNRYQDIKVTEQMSLPVIDNEITRILPDRYNNYWISTARDGLMYLRTDSAENLSTMEVFKLDTLNGLPFMYDNRLFMVNNRLLVATKKGLYSIADTNQYYKQPLQIKFVPDTLLGLNYSHDSTTVFFLTQDIKQNIWLCTQKGFLQLEKQPQGGYHLVASPFRNIKTDRESHIFIDSSGMAWLSSIESIYRYKPYGIQNNIADSRILIRKVTFGNNKVVYLGSTSASKQSETNNNQKINWTSDIPYQHNSVIFEFSLPEYENNANIRYRCFLQGYDNQWNDWQAKTERNYTNLPEGEYVFQVMARNAYGKEAEVTSFAFKIKPPYYRTWAAYTLYFFTLLALIFAGGRIYSIRLKRANRKLENMVRLRTEEIERQKEEIRIQAEFLSQMNKKLDKLSIVARETDNAVSIITPDGKIDWINEGFIRLYGYSYQDMVRAENQQEIFESMHVDLHKYIEECKEKKQSVVYVNYNVTKNGRKIWTQTVLTPIFDFEGNIQKFVSIDSDITRIKRAEQEIIAQNNRINAQKTQITRQNKEIKDSLLYARRIQTAMHPMRIFLDALLTDYFIINKPRDIVSGDFYFVTSRKNHIILAVADCTGHGVPGAFMSMLGITLLKTIVNRSENLYADQILNQLRDMVIASLHQRGKEGETQDGMDISIVVIEPNNRMQFAGANSSMYVIRHNEAAKDRLLQVVNSVPHSSTRQYVMEYEGHYLLELPPDKMPISIYYDERMFRRLEFDLEHGDALYMFSDGYIDQFGGSTGKKFYSKNLKRLVLGLQERTLEEQQQIISTTIDEWRGSLEQVDDMLLLGLRIEK